MRIARTESTTNKRAEEVRKRRTDRTQQRVTSVKDRVNNPVNVRPVIVRGSNFGTPIHRQAGTRARRAFYVTMDQAAGAELRLPAIPLVNPGWRLLSGLLVGLAIMGIFSLWNSPYFRVDVIDVVGLQRLSAEELTNALDLNNLPIVEVDPAYIEQTLQKDYPELAEVKATVELPNFVTISAVERQPVMAWKQGDQITWLDSQGFIFPARGDVDPLLTIHSDDNIPLAPVSAAEIIASTLLEKQQENQEEVGQEGQPAEEAAAPEIIQRNANPAMLTAALTLSQKLPPETTLVYDSQNGLGWMAPEGWQVYIGSNLEDFEAKFNMYEQLAAYFSAQGITPSVVSVAQLNAPFYRSEQ